jgi:predicted transcriptional regulator
MIENVAAIVSAYVGKNRLDPGELPMLIASVSQALAVLGQAPVVTETPAPAVSIRASIRPESLTCLACGQKSKMLKRHLTTAHSMSPDEYRTRWGLPPDYPMVAKAYSARRSELAKSLGLGRRGGTRDSQK